jgi:hypothetical protein
MALESMPNCMTGASMMPNIIAVLGGPQVFCVRGARVDLLEQVERGLPRRAYEAVSAALELTAGPTFCRRAPTTIGSSFAQQETRWSPRRR